MLSVVTVTVKLITPNSESFQTDDTDDDGQVMFTAQDPQAGEFRIEVRFINAGLGGGGEQELDLLDPQNAASVTVP